MLKIRLKKLGRKKKACYRIIAIDSRKKRDGRAIEEIGLYDPLHKYHYIRSINLKEKINQGAQLTQTVQNLVNKYYK